MHVEIRIPELTKYPNGFPEHWLKTLFLDKGPNTYQARALMSTYIRLVEGAYAHYGTARSHVYTFWNTHTGIAIGSVNLSSTYFEDCINCMHRAVLCITGIRGNKQIPADVKKVLSSRPRFATGAVANRIRAMRHAVQHMDERVLQGKIVEGSLFAIAANGPEVPAEELGVGQTRKIIDRLIMGDQEIMFSELSEWLAEMGDCAELISKYER
jgi:hypothetical protein